VCRLRTWEEKKEREKVEPELTHDDEEASETMRVKGQSGVGTYRKKGLGLGDNITNANALR